MSTVEELDQVLVAAGYPEEAEEWESVIGERIRSPWAHGEDLEGFARTTYRIPAAAGSDLDDCLGPDYQRHCLVICPGDPQSFTDEETTVTLA